MIQSNLRIKSFLSSAFIVFSNYNFLFRNTLSIGVDSFPALLLYSRIKLSRGRICPVSSGSPKISLANMIYFE